MSAGDYHNIQCPACDGDERFTVEFSGQCQLTSDGSEDCGDHEWDGASVMTCGDCGHTAPAIAFQAKYAGLESPVEQEAGSETGAPQIAGSYTETQAITGLCVWEALMEAQVEACEARHLDPSHASPLLDAWQLVGTVQMRDYALSLVEMVDEVWGLLPEHMTSILSFDWDVVPLILSEVRWDDAEPKYDEPAQIAERLADAFTAKMAA